VRIWLSQHVRTFAATVARLARAPVASLLNIGVIGVALAMPVGFYVGLVTLQALARDFAASPQLSLYLALDADRGDVARIESLLKKHPGVRRFRHISREEALRELTARAGLGDVIDGLGRNPLPDAFVIDAGDGTARSLETLRDEFRRWPGIEHVQLDSAWAQRLEALLNLGRLAVLMLGTLLAFALIAVTFNTIRLQIMTQRAEIEVAKLIGATNPFIRRPFLYYGTLLGLAGGLAAWAIVWITVHLLNGALVDLARLYGTEFRIHLLTIDDSLSLLLFAAWLGWFGAWLSVSRHLSEFEPY
jgi:cell division transport system permease protein